METNFTNSTVTPNADKDLKMALALFIGIVFSVKCAFIVALMFTQRRKNLYPDYCKGYFALIVPVNLLETRNRRKVYLCAFALIIMDVWNGFINNSLIGDEGGSTYAQFFIKLAVMTMYAFINLPFLAAITVGTVLSYSIGLFSMICYVFVTLFHCYSAIKRSSEDAIAGEILGKVMITAIVTITCGFYLIYWFGKKIIMIVIYKEKQKTGLSDYHVKYVKSMLSPLNEFPPKKFDVTKTDKISGILERLQYWFRFYVYYNVPGFRYSLSILIATLCALILLSQLTLSTISLSVGLYKLFSSVLALQESLKTMQMPNVFKYLARIVFKPKDGTKLKTDEILDGEITIFAFIESQLVIVLVSVIIASVIAYISNVIGLCHMLMSYRYNVLSLYRQKKEKILDMKDISNTNLVVHAIQFAGYQVAYMMWGFIIQSSFLTLICFIFGELVLLPLRFAFWYFVKRVFHFLMPFFITLVGIKLVQYLLVRFLFLEDRGKTLAIDNRKGFSIMMYMVFFYTILTGMFSCVLRIVKCTIIGIFCISRLDRSIFPRSFEENDAGFKAYTCLLHLEAIQCNPILVTFVDTLLKTNPNLNSSSTAIEEAGAINIKDLPKYRMVARNRWHVAVMMISNPSLITYRGIKPYAHLLNQQTEAEIL